MSWSYRRRVKIIPGVYLNFSKNGVSTSIGVRGASMTFRKDGTYLNTGIPGTGIYNRQKLSNGSGSSGEIENKLTPEKPEDFLRGRIDNIFSLDPQEITSQDMQGVKEAILSAQQQRNDLKSDLIQVQNDLKKSKGKLFWSYILIYGILLKDKTTTLKNDIEKQKETLLGIQDQIENSAIQLDIEFDYEISRRYTEVIDAFKKLQNSEKIWDVTGSLDQDRIKARSAASLVVSKKDVSIAIKDIPDIKTNFSPLYFENGNGADIYFYPNFLIIFVSKEKFAVVGINELKMNFTTARFIETGKVPTDTKIIDSTWAKVNKNGTPDKRFKDNYQIPIVQYGNITLKTNTGLNEEYEFSNHDSAMQFVSFFLEYQNIIRALKNL